MSKKLWLMGVVLCLGLALASGTWASDLLSKTGCVSDCVKARQALIKKDGPQKTLAICESQCGMATRKQLTECEKTCLKKWNNCLEPCMPANSMSYCINKCDPKLRKCLKACEEAK